MLCFSAQQIMIMDNHNVTINTFINNQNFTDANNLTDLLGNDEATEEVTQVKLSPMWTCMSSVKNCSLQKATLVSLV